MQIFAFSDTLMVFEGMNTPKISSTTESITMQFLSHFDNDMDSQNEKLISTYTIKNISPHFKVHK